WTLFPAVAATLAFNGDSDKAHSGRHALAMVAGAVMLFLSVIPLGVAAAPTSLKPITGFVDIWDVPGSLDFFEVLLLMTLAIVISLGPAAGGLLMFHSGIAIAAPGRRVRGAGPIAAASFLLYQPAAYFLLFLYIWMKANIVFTTYL